MTKEELERYMKQYEVTGEPDMIWNEEQQHIPGSCILPMAGTFEFCDCPKVMVKRKRLTLADYGRSVKINFNEAPK